MSFRKLRVEFQTLKWRCPAQHLARACHCKCVGPRNDALEMSFQCPLRPSSSRRIVRGRLGLRFWSVGGYQQTCHESKRFQTWGSRKHVESIGPKRFTFAIILEMVLSLRLEEWLVSWKRAFYILLQFSYWRGNYTELVVFKFRPSIFPVAKILRKPWRSRKSSREYSAWWCWKTFGENRCFFSVSFMFSSAPFSPFRTSAPLPLMPSLPSSRMWALRLWRRIVASTGNKTSYVMGV